MTVRPAKLDDLAKVKELLAGYEYIDLAQAVVLVAEEAGEIVGVLPARMVAEVEPLVVTGENKITRSRACLQLYRAMENELKLAGVRQIYTHTESPEVIGWAARLGWSQLYKKSSHFTRFPRVIS